MSLKAKCDMKIKEYKLVGIIMLGEEKTTKMHPVKGYYRYE